MKIIIPVIIAALLSVTAGEKSDPPKGQLIFHSGFEESSEVITLRSDADITGADKTYKDHNDWVNDLDNNPFIGNFNLQYQGGDSTQRYAAIIPEPGNPSNHVLKFWLNEPNVNGSKGRIQANIYGNNGLSGFSQSVRVFLHDDFNTVKSYPEKISWLTIAEFWNNITWDQKIPYRFRITLGIGKPVKEESDLYFIIDAEDCDLYADGRQKYNKVWAEINKDIQVPVGRWFTMEYYYREGNAETGRFHLAITPEGGQRQVIFDIRKFTHNTQDPAPDGVGDFNPMKLYTSKGLIDYMHGNGKTLQIYWDDFMLWKDKEN